MIPIKTKKLHLMTIIFVPLSVLIIVFIVSKSSVIHSSPSCMYNPSVIFYTLKLQPRPYYRPDLDPSDYNTLIDIADFRFKILNPRACLNSCTFILVLITSAPQNYEARQTIRETWGRNHNKVRTFFMLGLVSDNDIQQNIEMENDVYEDIIQGNFLDSYRNLTYKTVMALKFAFYHCPNVTYILKTDDDVFVNMPLMKNYLANDMSPHGAENYLQCHVLANKPVLRENSSKWCVTKEDYKHDYYPTYCNGPYAIFSPDVVFKLYRQAQKTNFFVFEDVFLYGLVAKNIPEIHHMDLKDLTLNKYWLDTVTSLRQGKFDHINYLFGPYGLSADEIHIFWDHLLDKNVPSSVYDYS